MKPIHMLCFAPKFSYRFLYIDCQVPCTVLVRSDLEEYRTTRDATTRQGLAIIWGLTVVILTVTVWCAWSVAVRLVRVL